GSGSGYWARQCGDDRGMKVRKRLEAKGLRPGDGRGKLFVVALFLPFLLLAHCPSAVALDAPQGVEAFDIPGDGGGSVGLRWRASPADGPATSYRILLSEQENGAFKPLPPFPPTPHYQPA